jgi:hypothetical protein
MAKMEVGLCWSKKMIGVVFGIMVQGTNPFQILNRQLSIVRSHPKKMQARSSTWDN